MQLSEGTLQVMWPLVEVVIAVISGTAYTYAVASEARAAVVHFESNLNDPEI